MVQAKYEAVAPETAYSLDWNINAEYLTIDHALITNNLDTFRRSLNEKYGMINHNIGLFE